MRTVDVCKRRSHRNANDLRCVWLLGLQVETVGSEREKAIVSFEALVKGRERI